LWLVNGRSKKGDLAPNPLTKRGPARVRFDGRAPPDQAQNLNGKGEWQRRLQTSRPAERLRKDTRLIQPTQELKGGEYNGTS